MPDKDSENAPVVSVTPPSPGVQSSAGLENGQLLRPEGENTVDSGATDAQPRTRSTSPHLQLKSLLKSPGVIRRKMAGKEPSAPKEKKDLSSDLEEEGTASEFHDDEHADGKIPVDFVMVEGSLGAKGCSCTSFPHALCTSFCSELGLYSSAFQASLNERMSFVVLQWYLTEKQDDLNETN